MGEIVAGMLYGARRKIEEILKEKQAFDEHTAIDPEKEKARAMKFKRVLELMEEGGLIRRTCDGRIYLTQKGRKIDAK
jgi:flavin-dependent dehydrogenase